MDLLQTLVMFVHVITVITLIVLVLIQHGKGADAGAAFGGGASQTVFGSQGSTGFLTKLTAALAVVFFITSFSLAIFAKNAAAVAAGSGITTTEQSAPAQKSESQAGTPAQSEKSTAGAPQQQAPAAQSGGAQKAQGAESSTQGAESSTQGTESSTQGTESSKSGQSGSGKGSGIPKLH